MKWKKLKSLDELPRDRSFLLYDAKASSGLVIYEAMIFDDGTMGCPATTEKYNLEDFSHWRPMIKLPNESILAKFDITSFYLGASISLVIHVLTHLLFN